MLSSGPRSGGVQAHPLDVQLLADLVGKPLDRAPLALVGRLNLHLGQRLPDLDLDGVPRGRAERDQAQQGVHVGRQVGVDQRLVGLGIVAVMDARAVLGASDDQVLIHRLGQERHHRREQLRQRHQHGVKRLIRRQLVGALLALPEPPAVAADVPVAQPVVDELLGLQAEGHHVERARTRAGPSGSGAASRTGSSDRCRAARRPAPAARSGSKRRAGRSCRRRRNVFQSFSTNLLRISSAGSEPKLMLFDGLLRAEHPADQVRAHRRLALEVSLGRQGLVSLVGRAFEGDGVALRLVHRVGPTGRAPGRGRAAP